MTLPPAAGTELAAAATAAGEEVMKLGDSEDTQDSSEGTYRPSGRGWPLRLGCSEVAHLSSVCRCGDTCMVFSGMWCCPNHIMMQ